MDQTNNRSIKKSHKKTDMTNIIATNFVCEQLKKIAPQYNSKFKTWIVKKIQKKANNSPSNHFAAIKKMTDFSFNSAKVQLWIRKKLCICSSTPRAAASFWGSNYVWAFLYFEVSFRSVRFNQLVVEFLFQLTLLWCYSSFWYFKIQLNLTATVCNSWPQLLSETVLL